MKGDLDINGHPGEVSKEAEVVQVDEVMVQETSQESKTGLEGVCS